MEKVIKTAPAGLPTTLQEVKTLLFINNDADDNAINLLIPACVSDLQDKTGQVFINQVWNLYYDLPEFSNVMKLGNFNVNSIVSVTTYDTDNNATVMTSSDYRLFKNKIIFNEDKYSLAGTLRQFQSINIEVNAGYGAEYDDIPEDIKLAIAKLVNYRLSTSGVEAPLSTGYGIPKEVEQIIFKYMDLGRRI